ncbi:putative transposase [Shigella dysenteriae 225-75]|nr:putative transposase [Shigella dysenteriae 225-75]
MSRKTQRYSTEFKPKPSKRFLKISFRSVKALPDYLFLKAL